VRFIYSKIFLAFAGCLVLVVVLLLLQTKGVLQPIEYALLQAPRPVTTAVKSVSEPIRGFFKTLFSIGTIVRENTSLRQRIIALEQQQTNLDKLQLENELLRKEFGFRQTSPYQLQPCTVLSIDPQELSDAIVLACGSEEEVKEGQAVLSEGFLIGKVVFVGSHTSTALLITNAQSAIDARISKNGVEGVVKGSFGSGMILDLVTQTAELTPGDLVVTAGINNRIPKDILIGEVGQIISQPNDLFKKASITSPIRFRSVDFVFVVKQ
jgi:rod shape-determining protein MreC